MGRVVGGRGEASRGIAHRRCRGREGEGVQPWDRPQALLGKGGGVGSHKQQSPDRNHLRRQSETVLWPSAMDEYRITCSKVSVPPRGNTIDWFPLTHTTHHHPQQCRLCRYNRRTQPARPREPSYMHQVTDSPPPAENKLQSSAARQRRSPESHTRRELARVSATS